MDSHRCSSKMHVISISAFLVAVALLVGSPVRAQQQATLSARYAKAALLSLLAIESDTSSPRDKTAEAAETSAVQAQIDAAAAAGVSIQEESITKMLRQIYHLKLHDNNLLMAYRKLTEIESAEDASDMVVTKIKKAYAVSEFADNEAAIENREKACFGQLEESLRQRSAPTVAACSEWIQKAKLSEKDPSSPRPTTKEIRKGENAGLGNTLSILNR
jgi:hypothetical protein